MKFYEYPSIRHFKETTGALHQHLRKGGAEVIADLVGTIKLHGANFSYVYDYLNPDESYFQSRNRTLTKTDKFFDFQSICYGDNGVQSILNKILDGFLYDYTKVSKIIIFGELCGGSIQKNVALQQLSKKFVAFDIMVVYNDDNYEFLSYDWLELLSNMIKHYSSTSLSCICDYPTYTAKLNVFARSEMLETQDLVSKITESVEKECPFGLAHGVSGIGEGVVWRSLNNELYDINGLNGFGLRFKVKGEEHSNSKVKTLKTVDSDKIEALKGLEEVCEAVCTEARFKQGMQYLLENDTPEADRKNTFLRWVVEDTIKEEMDYLVTKGIPIQTIKGQLFKMAVKYWQFHSR